MKTSPSQKDIELLPHKFQVNFAIFCARQVEHLWNMYPECVKAVETAELFLDDKASAEECRVAANAAYTYAAANAYANAAANAASNAAANVAANATTYATYAAANAAANAVAYATYATYAAANAAANAANATTDKQKIIEAQWEYYNNLLHFDSIAEQILLVGE